jgi:hypothetical protein
VFISNPHPNPQSAMSCTTFDTVEVCGSSPHGPTIFFNKLASATSLGKAPNGSIKEVVGDSQGLHVCGRRQMRRTRLPREQEACFHDRDGIRQMKAELCPQFDRRF